MDFITFGGHKFVFKYKNFVYKICPFFINKNILKKEIRNNILQLLNLNTINNNINYTWYTHNLNLYTEFETHYLLNNIFKKQYDIEFDNIFIFNNNIIFLILK